MISFLIIHYQEAYIHINQRFKNAAIFHFFKIMGVILIKFFIFFKKKK
jgi:hypothetical protein